MVTAIGKGEKPLPEHKLNELWKQAVASYNGGDFERTERLCAQMLAQSPSQAGILHLAGATQLQSGKLSAAQDLLRRAVELDPGNAEAWNHLGATLTRQQRNREAEQALRQALSLAPDYLDARTNLGMLCNGLNRLVEAEAEFRAVLALRPDDLAAGNNLALCLNEQGRVDESRPVYERLLSLHPDQADLHHNFGNLLKRVGDAATALEQQRCATGIDPAHSRAWLARAQLETNPDRQAEMLPLLHSLLAATAPGSTNAMRLHFALGQLADSGDHFALAASHLRSGNAIVAHQQPDRPEILRQYVDQVTHHWPAQPPALANPAGTGHVLPLFVTGLSRSGKSLLARMLGEIAGVKHGHEQTALARHVTSRLFEWLPRFPSGIDSLEPARLLGLRTDYLAELKQLSGGAQWVCDTLPANFMHLGVISLLFPDTTVIHCRRDPRDTALAMYLKCYGKGHDYTSTMEGIAERQQQHQRLLAFWRHTLGLRILDVDYEVLVADPPAVLAGVCNTLGLAPPAELPAALSTAGIGRWRAYAGELPGLEEIGPLP